MTQEIIRAEQDNRLVAEFMGLRIDSHPKEDEEWLVDEKNHKSIYHNSPVQEMAFDTSWDWLMPVVEKIANTTIKGTPPMNSDQLVRIEIVAGGYVKIENLRDTPIFTNVSQRGSLINAVYAAVIQFIQWYNLQSQTNKNI